MVVLLTDHTCLTNARVQSSKLSIMNCICICICPMLLPAVDAAWLWASCQGQALAVGLSPAGS